MGIDGAARGHAKLSWVVSKAVEATREGDRAMAHEMFRRLKVSRGSYDIDEPNQSTGDFGTLMGMANTLQYRLAASARRELSALERGNQQAVRHERSVQRAIRARSEAMLAGADMWDLSDQVINNQQFEQLVKQKHRHLDKTRKIVIGGG